MGVPEGTKQMSEATLDFESDPYVANHPQTRLFWAAAAQGQFLLPRCNSCERVHWYPRPFCPLCKSQSVDWVPASGHGVVYSFSVMRKAEQPYVLAYVQLAEGPAMMTNIVDAEFDSIHVGQPVKVAFRRAETGRSVPVFAPI